MVLSSMDTIKAKAFKQCYTRLIGLSPVKLTASLPGLSKDLGSKHYVFDSKG